jgi:hypothetical protein
MLSGKQNGAVEITARMKIRNEKDPELYLVGRLVNINNPPPRLMTITNTISIPIFNG